MPELFVDRIRLRSRHDMYLANHYVGLHNIVVSMALAVAGVAAASMLGLPESYRGYVPLMWMMLVASLLAIAVAYAGTVTGAPVLPPRLPAMLDLILPLLLGLAEFFLFGILAQKVTTLNSPQAVTEAWFVASAVFGASAALSVARARSIIARGHYDSDICPVVDAYVRRLRGDVIAASIIAVLGVGSAIYQRVDHGQVSWISYTAVSLMMAFFCGGFYSHARTRLSFQVAMTQPD